MNNGIKDAVRDIYDGAYAHGFHVGVATGFAIGVLIVGGAMTVIAWMLMR